MSDPTGNDPTPGDDSVITVLRRFSRDGWTANHQVVDGGTDGGRVKCGECGHIVAAGEIVIEAEHRVEGASDPDNMQLVAGFACPECGARGVVVVAYGPNSSHEEVAFLQDVTLGANDDPVSSADEH